MVKKRKYNPDGTPYEDKLQWRGHWIARCQATSKGTGRQCQRAAVEGRSVCMTHGAGTKKRVESGKRKDPARVGAENFRLYRATQASLISELAAEVETLGIDLDNTDPELVHLKAIVWYLKNQEGQVIDATETLDVALKRVRDNLESLEYSPDIQTIQVVAGAARDIDSALFKLNSYVDRFAKNLLRVQGMVKQRAEVKSKLAETRALEAFVERSGLLKDILLEILTPEQYDVFYQRLKGEVYRGIPEAIAHKA